MDFGAKPIATAPGSTQASILAEQMALLREQRSRMKEENAAYLSKHPELKTLLDEFMIAALTAKPPDVVKFAAIFFTQMKDPNIISGTYRKYCLIFCISACPNYLQSCRSHASYRHWRVGGRKK
jgi:hypothetical protein